MYRFVSTLDKIVLNANYKRIYAQVDFQGLWKTEVMHCRELAKTLPRGIHPEDLLTMSYEELVDIYNQYKRIYSGLSRPKQLQMNAAANHVFAYSKYRRAISEFLLDKDNGFKIYNCVYCDLMDVRPFSRTKRQFDTEHILDKGTCPLVGLSLYTFCPACDTCNTRCKGKKPIGSTPALMKKLSPTSPQYDFENQVRFVLNAKPEGVGRIKLGHWDWYEVDFNYMDTDYQEVVALFNLKERYNLDQHKQDAVEWRFKAQKYRGISLRLSAFIHGNTLEQEREEIFQYNARMHAHSEKQKLLKDMMML